VLGHLARAGSPGCGSPTKSLLLFQRKAMTKQEKRERAIDICEEALEFEAGPEQEGFVERRCGGDPELMGYVHEYIVASQDRSNRRSEGFSGKWIGPYRLDEELGRGSMGIVYRGFEAEIGRTVAVKVIRPQQSPTAEEDAEMKLRFTREAAAAGKLSHPNIVVIYRLGEESGAPYIAMEFVSGVSLDQAVTPGAPMDAQTAISIISQIADALDFAHAEGVVHRDIKPANIMVRPNGRITITDFGIARIVSQTMTKIGHSMGTPAYIAPEQIPGSRVDGKADQFSLAVIAYEILSGRKPFTADTDHGLLYQIMNVEPPALSDVNALLPPACASVVQRALSKAPDQRYPSCFAFVHALRESFVKQEQPKPVIPKKKPAAADVPPRSARKLSSRRIQIMAGVVGFLALTFFAVWMYSSYRPPGATNNHHKTKAAAEKPASPVDAAEKPSEVRKEALRGSGAAGQGTLTPASAPGAVTPLSGSTAAPKPCPQRVMVGRVEVSRFAGLCYGDLGSRAIALFGHSLHSNAAEIEMTHRRKEQTLLFGNSTGVGTDFEVYLDQSLRISNFHVNDSAVRFIRKTVGSDSLLDLMGKPVQSALTILGTTRDKAKCSSEGCQFNFQIDGKAGFLYLSPGWTGGSVNVEKPIQYIMVSWPEPNHQH
jgi:serine/threonine protein kinase